MSAAVGKVAIIGAGTMGGGIAITTALAGIETMLIDTSADSLARAGARLDAYLARQLGKGRIDAATRDRARANLSTATQMTACAGADLVIEAVFEKLDVKHSVLRDIEPLVGPDCVIATNTSCLKVSHIAAVLERPGRCIGLHYFSPAEISPVVELVLGAQSSTAAVDLAAGFLAVTGKQALSCRDRNGFALNRFFCPYCNAAVQCVEDGLGTPAQVDAVAAALFDQPIGPFAATNIVKPAIMLHSLENLTPLGAFYAPAELLRQKVQEGTVWEIGRADPLAPDTEAVIRQRLKGAVYLPLRDLLDEGVADGSDVDRGAALALRFGNGPVAMLRSEAVDAQDLAIKAARERVSAVVMA